MEEEAVMEALKRHFKFDSFKSQLQREAVLEIAKSEFEVSVSWGSLSCGSCRGEGRLSFYADRLGQVPVLPVACGSVSEPGDVGVFPSAGVDQGTTAVLRDRLHVQLLQDQIDHMLALKIRAASINSRTLKSERDALLTDLKSVVPSTRLLYVTPEQAVTQTFKVFIRRENTLSKLSS